MSIASTTGTPLSLVDYLYSSKPGSQAASPASGIFGSVTGGLAGYLNAADGGDSFTLSPTAQNLMAQQNVTAASSDGGVAAKDQAQNFLLGFFDESGVDLDKLSGDAIALLKGIEEMATDMGNVTQGTTVDRMTSNYTKGQRKSFTLEGAGERLSFTVQYKDGKPASMTILEVHGQVATNATISLTKDATGKLSGIHVDSVQKQYSSFGTKISSHEKDDLDLDLYAS